MIQLTCLSQPWFHCGTAVVLASQRKKKKRRLAKSLPREYEKAPKEKKAMISLVSASTATPENKFNTTELVASMMHKLSPELINTICSLGVDNRYSTMKNYADFLTGAPMNSTSSTTE